MRASGIVTRVDEPRLVMVKGQTVEVVELFVSDETVGEIRLTLWPEDRKRYGGLRRGEIFEGEVRHSEWTNPKTGRTFCRWALKPAAAEARAGDEPPARLRATA